MLQTIRRLAIAGVVAVALAALSGGYSFLVGVFVAGPSPDAVHALLLPLLAVTGSFLSFSAGVLALAQAAQRTQRLRLGWVVVLLTALVLSAYTAQIIFGFYLLTSQLVSSAWWAVIAPDAPVTSLLAHGLAAAAPALVALGYTARAARLAPQALQATEEQGSLDLTIERME